jgi:hypothetical protein
MTDLLDRMTESTAWTRTGVIDPAEDVRRGRTRLRRRRAGIAAAAVSAVTVTVVSVNTLTALETPPTDPPVATTGTPAVSVRPHCVGENPYEEKGSPDAWADDAERLLTAFARHADPRGEHLQTREPNVRGGCTGGYNRQVKGPWVDVRAAWRQDGDVDTVRIEIHPPGNYDDPQAGPSFAHPHLGACRKPPWPALTPYSCGWRIEDGRRVLVGTSDVRGYKSYLAGHVRPDGQFVLVRVESGAHSDPGTEQPKNPVRNPDVTVEGLVAAVTDPAMTLR